MAAPGIPSNYIIQQGNGQVLLSWDIMAGATSYPVYRSTDGVNFSLLASPVGNQYLDLAVTLNTLYYYKIQSSSSGGISPFTGALSIIPVSTGIMSLAQIRLQAQQRADRENSNFVTKPEWNTYINQAAFELYDLLTTVFEDYYVLPPLVFGTDGVSAQYNLTTIAPNFYKLLGVDLGLSNSANAYQSLKKFNFIDRNNFLYPQLNSTILGVFNLRYRLVGNTLMFTPVPSSGQFLRIWYIPRMTQLLQDTDILDGVNGWDEYVIVRAAKYALDKEESDTTKLDEQLGFLKQRIEETAANRDAGQPDTISDTRRLSGNWNGYYGGFGGGSFGGY